MRTPSSRLSLLPRWCCQVPQSEAPRRQQHWFSKWATTAQPPSRAESISFTHVINPFKGGQDPEHRHAQETTLRSIEVGSHQHRSHHRDESRCVLGTWLTPPLPCAPFRCQHAAALANSLGVKVDVICVMYPEDVPAVPMCASSGFRIVTLNLSAHQLLPQFRHPPARLPFVNQILYAGWLHGTGKYLTFSNIDIGVQAPFYLKVRACQLESPAQRCRECLAVASVSLSRMPRCREGFAVARVLLSRVRNRKEQHLRFFSIHVLQVARQLQLYPETPISLVREEYEYTPNSFSVENALGWRNTGLGHPGHDCWTFPRAWVRFATPCERERVWRARTCRKSH